jgi:hypothetical protein
VWASDGTERMVKAGRWLGAGIGLVLALGAATTAQAQSSTARSAAAWSDIGGRLPAMKKSARAELRPLRYRALGLDRDALARVLASASRTSSVTISLPAPHGGFQRFAVRTTEVMAPGLAAKHPDIATYTGRALDVRGDDVRLDLTPQGFHASVRGPGGNWYVDPYYHRSQSTYVSYRGADLVNRHTGFTEAESGLPGATRAPAVADANGDAVTMRTYRLALASDPEYAAYHGAANVTAAKVTLINRVNQIYEDDFAIHLTLVANNDKLNFDTAAEMTGANGPCGAEPCYTDDQAAGCDTPTLDRNRVVLGDLIGASNYDIGHIGMGTNGGGIAYLGVVGDDLKGGGCTGVTDPVGDLFAVDYVSHEMGHQFGGNHTFSGTNGACGGGNQNTPTAVEPGSGSSVMAYAGICAQDDLQPHSDPYFSQRSLDEITSYVTGAPASVNEVQGVSLRDFAGADSFRLTFNGQQSPVIARGTNYNAAGIAAAIKAIPNFPATGSVTVSSWDDTSTALTDSGFTVTFSGTLAGQNQPVLALTGLTGGATGFVGEIAQGGTSRNQGATSATANHAPNVTTPAAFVIPTRTPFTLTGAGTDAEGDTLSYLWEQNDPGSSDLVNNSKVTGPLFREFGTAAQVSPDGTLQSPSPGENAAGTSPARTFPDLAQVVAGDTNAATGSCPAAGTTVPPAVVDCYSEFLPTSVYAHALHFRLTARDDNPAGGGVGHADTTLTLAQTAGPFRVTSQATPASVRGGDQLPITWDVAGTNTGLVNVANVRITLSTDGGLTFPRVLSASTPNDGSQTVTLPAVQATAARIKVEAIGNVFFDVSHADLQITPPAAGTPTVADDAPAGGATVQYTDAPAQPITITANDPDTPGSALTATAGGLPAGMTLSNGPATAHARTFTVDGATTAVPGTYPVTVTVSDGDGHTATAAFDIVVEPEDAVIAYTGAATSSGPSTLTFSVADGSTAPGASDTTAGDVAGATMTITDNGTTICPNVPVVTAGDPATGSASCTTTLAAGAHHLVGTLAGSYRGSGAGDVSVTGASPSPTPTSSPSPTPTASPSPTPTPPAALVADLGKVGKRLKLSRSGRVSIPFRCRTSGAGAAPATCTGKLKLTIKGKTVGRLKFSLPPGQSKTLKVKLSRKARRALKRATAAKLTVTLSGEKAKTKKVKLVPRR